MDKKNKFLLITLEYPPFKGGVANYYENLVKNWPEDIEVLDNYKGKLINDNLPFLKWFPAIKNLRSKIKNDKFNYIIVGNILPLGTACYFLSKLFKFKYAVILHGTDIAYAQKKKRKKKLAEKILKKADKIICNSSYTFDLTQKVTNFDIKEKTIIVNPGINTEIKINKELQGELIEKYNLDNKYVLFSISRLIKRKGQDKLIQALQSVVQALPEVELFIAGSGPDEDYLKEMANSFLSIKKKIHFLGKISDEEKWAWFDLCDLFVLPSRTEDGNMEGFGIVYLEANLAGKAVVAGRDGGVEDAVLDKFNGVLVDPRNVNEIGEAVVELLSNESFRQKLGEYGKDRAVQEFDWQKQIRKIYDSITSP